MENVPSDIRTPSLVKFTTTRYVNLFKLLCSLVDFGDRRLLLLVFILDQDRGVKGIIVEPTDVHKGVGIEGHVRLRVLILVIFIHPAGEVNPEEVRLDLVLEEAWPEGTRLGLLQRAVDGSGCVNLGAVLSNQEDKCTVCMHQVDRTSGMTSSKSSNSTWYF